MVNFNEIAQDSPFARAYRQGRYSRVVDFLIHVADAAIGLRRASKNKEINVNKKTRLNSFTAAVELKKRYDIVRDFLNFFFLHINKDRTRANDILCKTEY